MRPPMTDAEHVEWMATYGLTPDEALDVLRQQWRRTSDPDRRAEYERAAAAINVVKAVLT